MRSLNLLLLAAAAGSVQGHGTVSNVVSLGHSTFNSFMDTHELVMAAFMSPSCKHSVALHPKYEKAALDFNNDGEVRFASVDCSIDRELCSEQEVKGLPALKLYRGSNSSRSYEGSRAQHPIASYVKRQTLPSVLDVTFENFEKTKALDEVVIIAFLSHEDKFSREVFSAFADSHRGHFLFGISHDTTVARTEGVDRPSVVLYKAFDERKVIYPGGMNHDSLNRWMTLVSKPLVGTISEETYQGYKKAGIPLAYIFAETKEERELFAEQLRPVARAFRGIVNIGTIDSRLYRPEALKMKPDVDRFPLLIVDDQKKKKFVYDQSKPLSAPEVASFLQDVVDGAAEPMVRSEPLPTKPGPVTVVTAKSYDEIVMDSKKDVLLEVYAPWCPHCQRLAPTYDKLGSLYAEHADEVIIAKLNGDVNDVSFKVNQIPTILLYPADDKDAPVDCSELRDLADFTHFIKDNGSHHVEVSVPPEWESGSEAHDEL